MKQIAIYSPKGGVGRTTISLHLADRLTASGRHVFLRDQDPQASALAFALLADQAGAPLQYTVGRGVPPQGTDITLSDYGPQELAMFPTADLIIVPAYGKQRSAVAARTDLDDLTAAVLERIDPLGIPDVFADVFRAEVAHG